VKKLLQAITCLAFFASLPVQAETYHVGNGCDHPLLYQQDLSVAATPAPDVNAPPDPVMDMETLTHPPIALHLPIEPYLNAPAYNVDLSRSDLEIGTLTLNHRGQLRFHNETLSSGASPVYSGDCQ
jgi:hypothetical protein